jgi:uncharacterized protein
MRQLYLATEIAAAVTNDYFKLIVNSTEQCNLRCTYCYEDFSLGRMPPKAVSGIINLVGRRAEAGLKLFELEFFGGEPLAAWSVVEKLSRSLHEICEQHSTSMVGSMTTNGILLNRQRLDALAANNVNGFQITLDGPETIHNKRRVTAKGGGTFELVWSALKMLKASPYNLNVLIRLHFDPAMVDLLAGPEGLIKRVTETFLRGDRRFSLFFHTVDRLGGAINNTIETFQSLAGKKDALGKLVAAAVDAGCLPQQISRFHDSTIGKETKPFVCYAARANAFVIRSDGRLAKCTVAFEDERNTVGHIEENGDLLIDHAKHLPWLQGLISGDAQALACPAKMYLSQPRSAD